MSTHSNWYTDTPANDMPSTAPSVKKPPPQNKPSKLLDNDENLMIFDIVGRGRRTLATAVVQLLLPTDEDEPHWAKVETGAACFVRDAIMKTYYIQIISLREKQVIFCQEIYKQFEYQMPHPFFLTFEGDNQMVGINFADTEEASTFRQVLDTKLRRKRDSTKSKTLVTQEQQNDTIDTNALNESNLPINHPTSAVEESDEVKRSNAEISLSKSRKFKWRAKGEKKTPLKKTEIGTPTNFRVVQHFGWDARKGFIIDITDPTLQLIFQKAGVTAKQLEDKNTIHFICDVIAKNGGGDALKNDISLTGPDPTLASHGNLQSNVNHPAPVPTNVPSIPKAVKGRQGAPPKPPYRNIVPAPLPTDSNLDPPSPPILMHTSAPLEPKVTEGSSVQKPSTSTGMNHGGGPPPPPPPPPPPNTDSETGGPLLAGLKNVNLRPDKPIESDSGSSDVNQGSSEPRSELWEEIKKGVSLRHVKTDPQPKRSCDPSREWLGDIKSGNISLRPVPEQVKQQLNLDEVDGLAGALARALAERHIAMNPIDTDNSDEDDAWEDNDDDEWD